jgi:hypothetical protein
VEGNTPFGKYANAARDEWAERDPVASRGVSNVVADALSRKKYCNATLAQRMSPELRREVAMDVEPTLEVEI